MQGSYHGCLLLKSCAQRLEDPFYHYTCSHCHAIFRRIVSRGPGLLSSSVLSIPVSLSPHIVISCAASRCVSLFSSLSASLRNVAMVMQSCLNAQAPLAHSHTHSTRKSQNEWRGRVWGMCVHGGGGGEKSALNQLAQTKRIIGECSQRQSWRGGEDSEGVCLICTGVLPSSCSQLTGDIFISLAHTVQKRNKFICKSTLPAKDKISAGQNIAVFQNGNHSLLFMHLPWRYHATVAHKAPPTMCPMKQKTQKPKMCSLKSGLFLWFLYAIFLFVLSISVLPDPLWEFPRSQ